MADDFNAAELGAKIKDLGITQAAVSKIVGIDPATLSRAIAGKRDLGRHERQQISRLLHDIEEAVTAGKKPRQIMAYLIEKQALEGLVAEPWHDERAAAVELVRDAAAPFKRRREAADAISLGMSKSGADTLAPGAEKMPVHRLPVFKAPERTDRPYIFRGPLREDTREYQGNYFVGLPGDYGFFCPLAALPDRFEPGDLVTVRPDAPLNVGSFVLASLTDDRLAIGRFHLDAGEKFSLEMTREGDVLHFGISEIIRLERIIGIQFG